VEQRQSPEDHVVRAEPDEVRAEHLGVAREVGVGQLGAFRTAGRAGRVQDHRGVVVGALGDVPHRVHGGQGVGERGGVDLDQIRVRGACPVVRLVCHPPRREDRGGPGVVQVVGHLAGLEQWVHRHDHAAGPQDAVVDDGELGQVGQHDRDAVAALQAAAAQ
jgi:hypothetical protein